MRERIPIPITLLISLKALLALTPREYLKAMIAYFRERREPR